MTTNVKRCGGGPPGIFIYMVYYCPEQLLSRSTGV